MARGDSPKQIMDDDNDFAVIEDEEYNEDEMEELDLFDWAGDEGAPDDSGDDDEHMDGGEEEPYVPSRDDSIVTFDKHAGSVFSCDLHPNGVIAASGGEDDTAYVWKVDTGEVLLTNSDFTDSVEVVAFNHDGKYLAVGSMSGQIVVYRIQNETITQVWSETVSEFNWLKWHPQANVILAGSSEMCLVQIPSGKCKYFVGHTSSEEGCFMPDGKRAIIGYLDGSVIVHDLQSTNTSCKFSPSALDLTAITSLACHSDNNLAAAGSVNGKLALVRTQQSKVVSIFNCSEDEETYSVESIAFGISQGIHLLIAGTDRHLYIWDYSKLILRHKVALEMGLTRMSCPSQDYLYIATRHGPVNIINIATAVEYDSLEGHDDCLLDLRSSKNGKMIITSGDDKKVRVFRIGDQPKRSQPDVS